MATGLAAGQGPRVGPDAVKPGQTQAGGKPAEASAKGEATAGAQAAVPEIEAGKNGEAHGKGNGDKAFSEFHRAAAELLAKADGHAPAPSVGDAASAIKASAEAVYEWWKVMAAKLTTLCSSMFHC